MILLLAPSMLLGQSFAVKVNAGSMGGGVEVVYQAHESANLRLGGNFFGLSYLYESGTDEEFDLDSDFSLGMFSLLADWHPGKSQFRVTGGLLYNNNSISAALIPKQSYTVGGDKYTPDELGRLNADFSFNSLAPYLALGFGNPFSGSRFGFNTDVGFVYQGAPKVSLSADGLLAPSAEQGPQLQENVSWAKFYPVLTFGLSYRIN